MSIKLDNFLSLIKFLKYQHYKQDFLIDVKIKIEIKKAK